MEKNNIFDEKSDAKGIFEKSSSHVQFYWKKIELKSYIYAEPNGMNAFFRIYNCNVNVYYTVYHFTTEIIKGHIK